MSNVIVLGAQWGDEGKGKVVDLLAERFDVVARYQYGAPLANRPIQVAVTDEAPKRWTLPIRVGTALEDLAAAILVSEHVPSKVAA